VGRAELEDATELEEIAAGVELVEAELEEMVAAAELAGAEREETELEEAELEEIAAGAEFEETTGACMRQRVEGIPRCVQAQI
jgi:hypothetical protein